MSMLRALLLTALLGFSLWALQRPWGSLPPIASLLDPMTGIWAVPSSPSLPQGQLELEGLSGEVIVRFDDRAVPHIFATNDQDLYMAQGFVMAGDRLWQMDFYARAASGRLSEVLGERALEYDRYQRRIGMVWGAERLLAEMEANDTTRTILNAFTAGINARIAQLKPADYPFEFKLLGYAPEPWSNLKTALMFMNIRNDLSGSSSEHRLANTRKLKGEAFMNQFFTNRQDWVDPIVPRQTPWNFTPLSVEQPETSYLSPLFSYEPPFQPNPYNGSNNWAVAGSKTATGKPLLSNDPHLNLTLPAIWYESQLVTPEMNVYGVSLTGTPGITIGFNQDVAWGLTNTGSDVLDWLQITWKDSTRNEYRYDGGWRSTEKRTEVIRVRGGADVVDEVVYTHHGPVALREGEKVFNVQTPVEHAMRWIAHDPSNEMMTIFRLNRSKNKTDLMQAIETFRAPAQNMVYATREGDIGIISNGALPVRWIGQGKYPGDGSDPRYAWKAFIPSEHLPQIHNPSRGFVSSANQHPAAPEEYPYYLDYAFASYERGTRINQRLAAMKGMTPDSMMHLLNDSYSLHAASILPRMLKGIQEWSPDSIDIRKHRTLLSSWDYYHEPNRGGAALFQRWWSQLQTEIWSDEFPEGVPVSWPAKDVMVRSLLSQPDGEWIDDKQTPIVETLDDLLRRSLAMTIRNLEEQQGEDPAAWTWVKAQNANVNHLLSLMPFNALEIQAGGCAECVNAFRNGNGPSWKMVVSLEDSVKAWGVYPGGQSGNPASPYYRSNLPTWESGNLHPLLFLKAVDEKANATVTTLTLSPKGAQL